MYAFIYDTYMHYMHSIRACVCDAHIPMYMVTYTRYIYACTSLHIHICIHIYTRALKTNAHLYIGLSIHLCIHTYTVMHTHTLCIHIQLCTHIQEDAQDKESEVEREGEKGGEEGGGKGSPTNLEWQRLVKSLRYQGSFAKKPYNHRAPGDYQRAVWCPIIVGLSCKRALIS